MSSQISREDEEAVDNPGDESDTDAVNEPEEKRSRRVYNSPAQTACKNRLEALEKTIEKLAKAKDQGLATNSSLKELKEAKLQKCKESAALKKMERQQTASRKLREKQRAVLRAAAAQDPKTPCQENAGRPRNPEHDGIIRAITELAIHGSAADERRRSEIIRTCRTLDDLYKLEDSISLDPAHTCGSYQDAPIRGRVGVMRAPLL